MLTHVVEDPEHYVPGSLGREVTLTLGWGTVSRLDLVPATCGDPECDADHGYEGTVTGDDIALRICRGRRRRGRPRRGAGLRPRPLRAPSARADPDAARRPGPGLAARGRAVARRRPALGGPQPRRPVAASAGAARPRPAARPPRRRRPRRRPRPRPARPPGRARPVAAHACCRRRCGSPSGFPSTTATSVASFGTGLAAGRPRAGRLRGARARDRADAQRALVGGRARPPAVAAARHRLRGGRARRGGGDPGRPGVLRRLRASPTRWPAGGRFVAAALARRAGRRRRSPRCAGTPRRSSTSTGRTSTRSGTSTGPTPGSGATRSRPSTASWPGSRRPSRRLLAHRHRRPRDGRGAAQPTASTSPTTRA